MCGRCPRWGRLFFLAALNLAVWLGLAVGVARLAGEDMNLGIEQLVRRGQATAVSYLRLPPAGRPDTVPAGAGAVVAQSRPGAAVEQIGAASGEPRIDGAQPGGQMDGPPIEAGELDVELLTPQSGTAVTAAPGAAAPASTDVPVLSGSALAPLPPAEATRIAAGLAQALILSDPAFSGLMANGSSVEAAAQGQRVEIQYGESRLNQEIAALMAQTEDLPYDDVQLSVHSDRVLVTADVSVLGIGVKTELLGQLVVDECALRMEVSAVSVGGVLTPRFIKNAASDTALRALNWYPADSPLCLDRVVTGEGRLTLYGYRR